VYIAGCVRGHTGPPFASALSVLGGTISGNSAQQLALWLYKPKFKVHAGSKVYAKCTLVHRAECGKWAGGRVRSVIGRELSTSVGQPLSVSTDDNFP
jgi:cytochrome c2